MTKKEAVIAALQITGYSDAAVEKALLDNAITGSGIYSSSDRGIIDTVAIEVLQGMLSVASISEGGMSVTYSIQGVKDRIAYLQVKNGIDPGGPKVRRRDVW